MVMSVWMGADDSLMARKMRQTKLFSKLLRPVHGQPVIRAISGIKADDIVVTFYILPFLIFAVTEICPHAGNGKIFVTAVQSSNAIILSGNEPAVFI